MNAFFRQAGFLLMLAILPSVAVLLFHPNRPVFQDGSPEVTMEEIQAWNAPVLWVDAREAVEYAEHHIPGAVNLNETDWENLIDGFLDVLHTEVRVVIYCKGGECNASRSVAGKLAAEAGLTNLFILKGGIEAWRPVN